MNSEEVKLQSKKLKEFSKKFGYNLKHSHALEIVSNLFNSTNWHVSSVDDPNFIKTGLKSLDDDLGGGLKKGTFTSVLSGVNSGKTFFCISIVCNALRKNKKVLIYSLDESYESILSKILSNLANISYEKIISKDLTQKEKDKIKKISNRIKNNLIIEKNNINETIENLKENIFEKRVNFKFDLLFIDYSQLITIKNTNNKSYREISLTVHKELKKISKAYHCTIISPVQATKHSSLNFEKGSQNLYKLENIAETISIAEFSDNIISLNMTENEKNHSKMRVYLEKNRNGIKNKIYSITLDFTHCNFLAITPREIALI